MCPCVSDQQSRTSEQTQLQSPCETADTELKAGELWYPFWLAGARLSHCGNTLVVQTPLVASALIIWDIHVIMRERAQEGQP